MTDEKIKILIDNIKMYVDQGWSIGIAKKRVLGSESSIRNKDVLGSELYRELLNYYLMLKNKTYNYEFVDGKLKPQDGRRKRGRDAIN